MSLLKKKPEHPASQRISGKGLIKKLNRKQLGVLLIGVLILSLGAAWAYWYKNSKGSQRDVSPKVAFIRSLPQLANIDTSKEVCFDMSSPGSASASIDCFIPDEIDLHSAGFTSFEEYKKLLQDSKILNAKSLKEEEKSSILQFYDSLQPTNSKASSYFSIRSDLMKKTRSTSWTAADYKNLAYLLSLEWDYIGAKDAHAMYCKKANIDCSKDVVTINISGTIQTSDGKIIQGVSVKNLGGSEVVKTDDKGVYVLKIQAFPGEKIRIEANKKGMSNGVFATSVLSDAKQQLVSKDFTLEAPVQFAVIDTNKKTITGENASLSGSSLAKVKTKWSEYTIPFDALVHANGKPYKGQVIAYFFEFDKTSQNQNLLENDIFDDVVGYAGNLMKTFGMPYVLFVTEEGERIHVLKDRPMLLRNKIAEMEALRTNQDKIYEPLTDDDLKFLIQRSKELGGFPITREFLIENNLLRYPVFWVFDQTKGIWVTQGTRVVSAEGISEMPFYTISEPSK